MFYLAVTLTNVRESSLPEYRATLRLENLTKPSAKAKRVSSVPRPTFFPGCHLVPRWRTKTSPVFTTEPSERLTPRYFGCESRP